MREAGPDAAFRIEANLFRCETRTRVNWSDSVVSTRGGPDAVLQGVPVDDPSWAGRAGQLSLEGVADPAYRRAIADELARCVLPAGTALAVVALDAEAPHDRTPLVKHVAVRFSGTVTLQVKRDGARRLRWVGTFDGEVELDARGFLAASRVAPEVGARLGVLLRDRIEAKRSALEEQLGG